MSVFGGEGHTLAIRRVGGKRLRPRMRGQALRDPSRHRHLPKIAFCGENYGIPKQGREAVKPRPRPGRGNTGPTNDRDGRKQLHAPNLSGNRPFQQEELPGKSRGRGFTVCLGN